MTKKARVETKAESELKDPLLSMTDGGTDEFASTSIPVVEEGSQGGEHEDLTAETSDSRLTRTDQIQQIRASQEFKSYQEKIAKFSTNYVSLYLTGGVAAVGVGTTVLGFLTPLNAMMLVDRITNSSLVNSTFGFDNLNSDQTLTFGVIVPCVFVVKGGWMARRLYLTFQSAPAGSFTPGKHALAVIHGIMHGLSPVALLIGVVLGNFVPRLPAAFRWVPEQITAPRAFLAGGFAAMLAEVSAPNEEIGDHEGCKQIGRYIASRFKALPPWEIVVLFLLTINIDASAETNNYWNHPVVAQSIATALTPLLGGIILTMGIKQCCSRKSKLALANNTQRLASTEGVSTAQVARSDDQSQMLETGGGVVDDSNEEAEETCFQAAGRWLVSWFR